MSGDSHPGDEGYTGILGEGRFPKYDLRLEVVGSIDEISSALGLARAAHCTAETGEIIRQAQRDLYGMMSEVAATPENAQRFRVVDAGRVAWITTLQEDFMRKAHVPKEFILPGDTSVGAALDLARTVTRRAERRMAELFHRGGVENAELLRYLNRLSLLCFALELYENQVGGIPDPSLAKPQPGPE
jgi:cob(I)alamin adenosyltransferase